MAVIKTLNDKGKVKQLTDSELAQGASVSNKVIAFYDAIVGSGAQVATGAATHTSIQAAHDYVGNGGVVLILRGTYTENVTFSNSVRFVGQGHSVVLIGNLTLSANYCDLDSWKVNGAISLSGNNNFLKLWLSSTGSFVNSGLANFYTISGE